jgi:polar amino acid transport system substrate-binding protein
MQCYLDLLSAARIDSSKLTSHRFVLGEARQAYSLLAQREVDRVGIVLSYPFATANERNAPANRISAAGVGKTRPGGTAVSFIGAGAYAKGTLLPLFARQSDVHFCGVATRSGATSSSVAKQFAFAFAANSPEEIFRDDLCNSIVIATRHDTHAELAAAALRAGKNVWVEKPLALTVRELREVRDAWKARPDLKLVVGFNRPFSPLVCWIKRDMPLVTPMMITYRVNAGWLPCDHWANDPTIGGGRLRGEGCHFLDVLRSFCGDPATVSTVAVAGSGRTDLLATGNFTVTVTFCNGSIGTVIYSAQGSSRLPKERIEIFCGNACGVIDDFKHAKIFIGEKVCEKEILHQDKGQSALIEAFVKNQPLNPEEFLTSSLLTLAAQASLERQMPVNIADFARSENY